MRTEPRPPWPGHPPQHPSLAVLWQALACSGCQTARPVGAGSETGRTSISTSGTAAVLYGGTSPRLHAVDVSSGKQQWRHLTTGPILAPAIAQSVLCHRSGRHRLRLESIHRRRPVGPRDPKLPVLQSRRHRYPCRCHRQHWARLRHGLTAGEHRLGDVSLVGLRTPLLAVLGVLGVGLCQHVEGIPEPCVT